MKKQSWLLYSLAVAGLLTPVSGSAQTLWDASSKRSMFSDLRAHEVGDLLTILVQENSSANQQKSTKTAKNVSYDAAVKTFLYSAEGAAGGFLSRDGKMPALQAASKSTFDGSGEISNSEKITTRITVQVIDVLPNGTLVVEGRRQTKMSGETTDSILRGVVRTEDITANNTVFSYNVANATIHTLSKGVVTDSTRKGWFTKIWDKVSPF